MQAGDREQKVDLQASLQTQLPGTAAQQGPLLGAGSRPDRGFACPLWPSSQETPTANNTSLCAPGAVALLLAGSNTRPSTHNLRVDSVQALLVSKSCAPGASFSPPTAPPHSQPRPAAAPSENSLLKRVQL